MAQGSSEEVQVSLAFQDSSDQRQHFFGYKPLNKTTKEIRILSFLPGGIEDAIICRLEHRALDQASPFHALSYVWGEAGATQPITVDGERLEIRESLWWFLHSLRALMQGVLNVWLDIVCINQQDEEEKNFQVSMMGDIFSSAESVLAWLGQATAESELAFDYAERAKALCAEGATKKISRGTTKVVEKPW
jgi:hypothetical protein